MEMFNSENWFPAIKQAARDVYKHLDKSVVSYNESVIDVIKKEYPVRLGIVKGEIYGDGSDDVMLIGNRIDRHKITALYVRLFLEKPIFTVNYKNSEQLPSVTHILANEIFCFNIIRAILSSWYNKKIDKKKFEPYVNPLLKLLYHYKQRCDLHKNVSYITHTIAHLIYFIERDFFE
jgi:hypothetical protein